MVGVGDHTGYIRTNTEIDIVHLSGFLKKYPLSKYAEVNDRFTKPLTVEQVTKSDF